MKHKNKKLRYLVIYTMVVVVLFVTIFAMNQASSNKENTTQTTTEAPSIASQPTMGNRDAKVQIVEFGDYKCPSCKAWGEKVWPQLKAEFVDTGKASFSYINVLFHGEESRLGALASEAVLQSNPEEFWNFHKALYHAQPDMNHDSLWITKEKIVEVAEAAVPGIDIEQLQKNLTSKELQSLVNYDQQVVKDFSITLTPTIMINNKIMANPFDYAAIVDAIEQELKER